MSKYKKTTLDRARDELMSQVIRCNVLEFEMEQREEWLDETMRYISDRYPSLSELQIAQLEMVGGEFIKPPIRHGAAHDASTRDANIDELVEEELEETAV